MVHHDLNKAVLGDVVAIEHRGKKISKQKLYEIAEILYKAEAYRHPVTGQLFTRETSPDCNANEN